MVNGVTHDAPEPETRRRAWMPLNVGTALILATVLALVMFFLTSSGKSVLQPVYDDTDLSASAADIAAGESATTAPPRAAVPTGTSGAVEQAPPTTIPAGSSFRESGAGDATVQWTGPAAVLSLAGGTLDIGPTDVGFVSQFPTVDYSWQRVEIDTEPDTELSWLGEIGGRLVAVTSAWTDGWTKQSVVTYVSDDGFDWERAGALPLPEDSYVSRVFGDETQVYLLAETWDSEADGPSYHLFVTSDGATWNDTSIDLGGDPTEYVYIQNAAVGPAGLVVAAQFETQPEEQPAVLDFGKLQVSLEYGTNTYHLFDVDTGDEVLSGSMDDLFHRGGDEGQPVYDASTSEIIVTIPFDVWDSAFERYYYGSSQGSPLPLPIYSEGPSQEAVSIEYDGFVVLVDDMQGTYRVIEAESGDDITSGAIDYLYQGPPPRLVDPETGAVLLEVTWDEWYLAEEQSWRYVEDGDVGYTSRTELLTTADLETWESVIVPGSDGSNVLVLLPTEDGFVAMVDTYGDYGNRSSVWRMSDGVWSSADREFSDIWLNETIATADGFVAVGDGNGGSGLWTSSDGADWISEFAIVSQSDGSYAYLLDVAADEAGSVAVLSQRENWSDYQALVIEKDGYTLTFDDGETVLAVTDTAGELVLSLGWDVIEAAGTDLATWEDGVTYIDLGNGDVVAITDEEAYAAIQGQWADQGWVGATVFLKERGTWSEATVEIEGGLSGANQVYLFDGKIVIAGNVYPDGVAAFDSELADGSNSFVVVVGAPGIE